MDWIERMECLGDGGAFLKTKSQLSGSESQLLIFGNVGREWDGGYG